MLFENRRVARCACTMAPPVDPSSTSLGSEVRRMLHSPQGVGAQSEPWNLAPFRLENGERLPLARKANVFHRQRRRTFSAVSEGERFPPVAKANAFRR